LTDCLRKTAQQEKRSLAYDGAHVRWYRPFDSAVKVKAYIHNARRQDQIAESEYPK
jgi:hypothetical protein